MKMKKIVIQTEEKAKCCKKMMIMTMKTIMLIKLIFKLKDKELRKEKESRL